MPTNNSVNVGLAGSTGTGSFVGSNSPAMTLPSANNFLEGYATYLGGSKGNDLLWHVRRLHQYLYYHDSLNLNDLLSFRHMDDETDPTRTIGGLLCMIADEKGGLPAIKKLLSYGNTDVAFYNAIEVVFGVKKEGINVFIRQKIAEYSKR